MSAITRPVEPTALVAERRSSATSKISASEIAMSAAMTNQVSTSSEKAMTGRWSWKGAEDQPEAARPASRVVASDATSARNKAAGAAASAAAGEITEITEKVAGELEPSREALQGSSAELFADEEWLEEQVSAAV